MPLPGRIASLPKRAAIRAGVAALATAEARRSRALHLPDVRNFLLLQHHRALGAAVTATAFPLALRAALRNTNKPDARIVVGASGFSLDTFAGNPAVDRVIPIPDPRLGIRAAAAVLRRANLFGGDPFVTLLTIGNARGEPRAAAYMAGSLCSLGYAFTPDAHNLVYDHKLSRVSNDHQLLHRLGHADALARALRENPTLHEPRMYPALGPNSAGPDHAHPDVAAIRALLQEQGIVPGRPIAVFITQARPFPPRTWPAERFREVATWLHQQHGMQIVFTGGPADAPAIEALRHPTDGAAPLDFPTANLAGRTTLPQLAALAAAADIGLCLDTGPMHVARAVALPMVILAADTQAGPIEWLPLNHPRMPLAFSAYTPPGTGYPMPGDLPAAEVQQKLDALLTLHPEIKRPTRSAQLWANASGVGAQ